VGLVADINAGGIGMHDFQAEVLALDFPHRLPSLLAVHCVLVIGCWTAACVLVVLNSLGFHANLSTVNSTWLGPVGDPYTVSLGIGPLFFSEKRRHHLHHSPVPEPCSFIGQECARDVMRS
jgi:hypothetical protein